uniref:Uncharacterized protein n=1 Tax=Anguilla anguilla TaxID=7936 RepID=A0A0E9R766_ANGAN
MLGGVPPVCVRPVSVLLCEGERR